MSTDTQKGVGLLKTKYVEQAPKSPALGSQASNYLIFPELIIFLIL